MGIIKTAPLTEAPDIFNRIAHGLKEDWRDPATGHVWKVRKYLAGFTPGCVEVWYRHKFLGKAYCGKRYPKTVEERL